MCRPHEHGLLHFDVGRAATQRGRGVHDFEVLRCTVLAEQMLTIGRQDMFLRQRCT